jgi:chaperone required for assembly of F1-ATPase
MTRSLFDDWFAKGLDPAAYDPVAAARLAMKPQLPKRFYEAAGFAEVDGAFALTLDGRKAKTPGRKLVAMPSATLAEAVAAEWQAQAEYINPATMPLTRIVNAIIEGVTEVPAAVAEEIVKYAGSDLLCYRADRPQNLVDRQAAAWDPVLTYLRETIGARFYLSEGVVFVEQPEPSIAAVRAALPGDPWRLGAMSVITTLTGSALLAIAVERGFLSADQAFAAAHVDDDFQRDTWGHDDEAAERRAARRAEMMAAAKVLSSL